jgi:hypothetical protein
MVVAVILILAASASATPIQPVSTLLACTAAQLSLAFDGEGIESNGRSQSGALRGHRVQPNGVQDRRSFRFSDTSRSSLRLPLEAAASHYLSPVFAAASFSPDTLRSSFISHASTSSGREAQYRFDYLKRDLVYVRSKS